MNLPLIEAGRTYFFHSSGGTVVKRPVVAIVDKTVLYVRLGKQCTIQLKSFQRLYEQYGVKDMEMSNKEVRHYASRRKATRGQASAHLGG